VGRALWAGGIDCPDQETRELVLMATALTPLVMVTDPRRRLNEAESARVETVLARRLAREPLTRIAGHREFYGRDFLLSPATLDPRPDTETLVEAVLQIVDDEGWRQRSLRLLDLGTGTGCLLITLLAELPLATGIGIDIAAEAVATAEKNSERLGAGRRAAFHVGDGPAGVEGSFDLVISNPPYIRTAEIDRLEPEVREFDPRAALDGGADGLIFYRSWIQAAVTLAPTGWIAFEVGAGQADDVAALLETSSAVIGKPFRPARRWKDLGGHTRVVAIGSHP